MSYEDRDIYGMYKRKDKEGPGPRLMGADTLLGDDVYNHKGEDLGDIKEIMLDTKSGSVAYAVLSFGGIAGIGEKLFAVPWRALKLDTANKRFALNVDKERLESAPGFDKDDWPDMADPTWQESVHSYYGVKSYTEEIKSRAKPEETSDTPDTPYEETPYTKPQKG
ncbi:MAG TPA: PRC-barrel domain-containing protein [Nitrosospira sp.]|nr:PRC-barrel domain-containing protein [Nitrosospira sp.]